MSAMIEIGPLTPADYPRWEELARGYKAFYRTTEPDDAYPRTWRRLLEGDELHGLGARHQGELIGIVHFLFHASVWAPGTCYLQDLFVDERARGLGAARALIERVADETRARGLPRLYWLTMHDNAPARALYDKVAVHRGFVVYEYPLD